MKEKPKRSTEDNLRETERLLNQLQADQKRREALDNLPPKLILKARELSKKGEFKRRVVERTPKNFDSDTLKLECGHAIESGTYRSDDTIQEICHDCLERWLLNGGKRGKKAK